jgi:hypothetical protein
MFGELGKILIIVGLLFTLVGALFLAFQRFPFLGHLPGDFSFKKGNFQFYFPCGTSILISIFLSILLTLIFWLLRSKG